MKQTLSTVVLKAGRDKNARQRHPWIFSGAIARVKGDIAPGEIVRVTDAAGGFVAYGFFNSRSQIRVRLLGWDEETTVDEAWWFARVSESVSRRAALAKDTGTNAYRLIYGESDFLPGVFVDKYADFLVAQFHTAGAERVKAAITAALAEKLWPRGIYERSDADSRAHEGLAPSLGTLAGEEPPEFFEIKENGLKFKIDIKSGQKSGYYLDQRDNRVAAASFAKGREVLDCFSYTGGFSVYALAGGAKSATLVESSAQSMALARENVALNGLDSGSMELIEGDVFKMLRRFRGEERKFDMVILDPPKFAPTRADLKKALSGYKDINLLAMQLLRPDGILATFSCSGAVDPQTLQTVIFWASTDAGRPAQILKTLSQGADHPRLASFPESEYLKGFICRIV
jgi:23S rRNA (cytosine1962-C5)-methyltransferase